MTGQPLDPAVRKEALQRYSHANVRDRYDADLLMAGFEEGARWAEARLAAALAAAQERETALTKDRDGWVELAELRLAARMAVQGALTAEQETVRRVEELATRAAMLSTRISPSSVRAALAGEGAAEPICGVQIPLQSVTATWPNPPERYVICTKPKPCPDHGEGAADRACPGCDRKDGTHDEGCMGASIVRPPRFGEGDAEVTLHADRALPPNLAQALADLAQATVDSVQPSYAVFVCAQGIIGCRAVGEHQEHDLAERPFIRAQDSSADAQTVVAGEGAAGQPKGSNR